MTTSTAKGLPIHRQPPEGAAPRYGIARILLNAFRRGAHVGNGKGAFSSFSKICNIGKHITWDVSVTQVASHAAESLADGDWTTQDCAGLAKTSRYGGDSGGTAFSE